MRKILLLSCTLLFIFNTDAQNVPNGSFENWETRDHYKLDGWYSPTRNVKRTTDAKVGNYALKLENTYIEGSNGYTSYVRNLDYNNRDQLNGFAFDGDPLSLVFYSKHDLPPGDEARIYAIFRENGSTKGVVDFRFTGNTADTFVRYSIPITWYSARTPDSVWLYLYSYSTESKVEADGYVIFDDIHFDKIGERMDDVTNADFEDWTNIGVEYPTSWETYDLLYYDLYSAFVPSNRTSARATGDDAYIGDNALKLTNWYSSRNRYSYHYTGSENGDYNRPIFEMADTFKYLQGYYKYLPESGDTALLRMRCFKGTQVRSTNYLYLGEAEDWTFFTMPLTYSTAVDPDSASIMIYSSYLDSIGLNTELYLDGLEMVFKPHSVFVEEIEDDSYLYPNPTESIVTVILTNNAQVEVINTLGQTIKTQQLLAGNNIIDLQENINGIYYLKFKSKTNQWTTKVMKR
jgi:hypothetical protein